MLANEAIAKDVDYDDVINLDVREKIGRAKYIPEEDIAQLDDISKEVRETFKSMINVGENV